MTARFEHWRYRLAEVTDPTGVAITITRRSYDCIDPRCEDHVRLETGRPCGACAHVSHEIAQMRLSASQTDDHQLSSGLLTPTKTVDALTDDLSASVSPVRSSSGRASTTFRRAEFDGGRDDEPRRAARRAAGRARRL